MHTCGQYRQVYIIIYYTTRMTTMTRTVRDTLSTVDASLLCEYFLPPLSVQTWMRAKRYDSQFEILDCLV